MYETLLDPDICNPLKHDFKDKHLWIKKATGLGVTEFFLRFMAWLCLRNDGYRNSQMCIVTGPNIDIAIKLIKRMKSLFERKLGLTFANKETVLELNGCRIEAYPSNHIDAYRALASSSRNNNKQQAEAEEGYDLIAFFDCLHDMEDPQGAAAHALKMLKKPDGTVMIVEPFANDKLDILNLQFNPSPLYNYII